jgi:hypothetical protein
MSVVTSPLLDLRQQDLNKVGRTFDRRLESSTRDIETYLKNKGLERA